MMLQNLSIDTDGVNNIATNVDKLRDDLQTKYNSLQTLKNNLAEHWSGDESSSAAQTAIDNVLRLYNSLINTVDETSKSLKSAASGFEDTDNNTASTFRRFN